MMKQRHDPKQEAIEIIEREPNLLWPLHITIPREIVERIAERIARVGSNAVAYGPLEILTINYFKYRKQTLALLDIPREIDVYIHIEKHEIVIDRCNPQMWYYPHQKVILEANQEIILLDIINLEPLPLLPITQEANCAIASG